MSRLETRAGFTLIELLVVIAIIGILSAVVLAALTTARGKGQDAAIESDLGTIQTEAEAYYPTNSSYGVGGSFNQGSGGCNCLHAGQCMFDDPTIKAAFQGADQANGSGGLLCFASSGTSYAVVADLVANPGKAWCVDSTDYAGLVSGSIAGGSIKYGYSVCVPP